MPAMHNAVNIKNAICIVCMRSLEVISYSDTFPTVPLTTKVIIAIPVDCPVVRIVASIEFATPNLAGGTQLIITFVLGDEKSEIPIPATERAMMIIQTGVSDLINAKNSSEKAHSPIPIDASL